MGVALLGAWLALAGLGVQGAWAGSPAPAASGPATPAPSPSAPSTSAPTLDIAVEPATALVGTTGTGRFVLQNTGSATIVVTGVTLEQEGQAFWVDGRYPPFALTPGERRAFVLYYQPVSEASTTARLRIATQAGEIAVPVYGSTAPSQGIGGLIGTQGATTGAAAATGDASADGGTAASGSPVVLGSLEKAQIDAVIKRNMNQLRYCYQRELTKDATLAGRVTVKFVIAKDGTVSSATTKESTFPTDVVPSCINGRFMKFQFAEPAGGGIVIVSYPFIFSPG